MKIWITKISHYTVPTDSVQMNLLITLVWTSSLSRVGQNCQYCIFTRSGGLTQHNCLRGQQVWSCWTHKGKRLRLNQECMMMLFKIVYTCPCLIPRPQGVKRKWPGYEVTSNLSVLSIQDTCKIHTSMIFISTVEESYDFYLFLNCCVVCISFLAIIHTDHF